MSKTTLRAVIDDEVEQAWRAGIMQCLVWYCEIDSPKANKLVDEIAKRPNLLPERKRKAGERITGAILATVVDEKRQGTLF